LFIERENFEVNFIVEFSVGYAKNRAVRQSTGEYLCFCDADDVSLPTRIHVQIDRISSCSDPKMAFIGACFRRIPEESTRRFTKWANSLTDCQLYTQVFTSHGPTLVAPTWLLSRYLFDSVGGFYEDQTNGYPEDLIGAKFIRVDECVVLYRYHTECTSFGVSEEVIWQMRVQAFEEFVLLKWSAFTIWSAGKQGKRFYRSLKECNRRKVIAFCDVDSKKIARGIYEHFDSCSRSITARIPIIPLCEARTPVAICVKLDLTHGAFEALLDGMHWIEGIDYYHLS
uniref:Glyco_trans_2-like domain-containing protein n=1 Tax=Anisakis simplex TaxID=6269 RepID=A0A0M3IZN2_ANISI